MTPLEDFIKQLTELEDEFSNFCWSLNTPIRDYAPASQHQGLHAEIDRSKIVVQDELDKLYRLTRDVQEMAMQRRVA